MASNSNMIHRSGDILRLKDRTVKGILTPDKRRLVEVPYTASLAHTVNALVDNRVGAVPVAAPPGHWIGAGGSMILEADKATGAVRKHYIGMVTMLDILAHIAEEYNDGGPGGGNVTADLDTKMAVPVSSIIGHCLESLSLWTLNPNTSIPDCMEVFSKGIHRALVPLDGNMENTAGVELVESASAYRMLTQMDLLRFLKAHEPELHHILSRTVTQAGGISDIVFGVTNRARVIEVIKQMRTASLNAVPIVDAYDDIEEDHTQLVNRGKTSNKHTLLVYGMPWHAVYTRIKRDLLVPKIPIKYLRKGKGRKLVGTFSATDLRECPIPQMQPWLLDTVMQFKEKLQASAMNVESPRELVTCRAESPLSEVIDKAVSHHVHRVWVMSQDGLLEGLVSLTDMIRVIRAAMLSET